MKSYIQRSIIGIAVVLTISGLSSCRKLVQIDAPSNSLTGAGVYSTDATAIAAVTSIYVDLSPNGNLNTIGPISNLSLMAGLSADEFNLWDGVSTTDMRSILYKNMLSTTNSGNAFWNANFNLIFRCNDALTGLNNSNTLTPLVKKQLLGEVKFLRGLFYFYLTNLYGDVPLVLLTDYKLNASIGRSSQSIIYTQIIKDLTDAQQLLSDNYLDGTLLNTTSERIRPNSGVATALLAKVYLYNKDYTNADAQASKLISNTSVYGLSTLANAFLKASLGNKEAIWQLQPINVGFNTAEATTFVLPPTGPNDTQSIYLSPSLLSAFETGDQRLSNWVGRVTLVGIPAVTYYFPYKYKLNLYDPTITASSGTSNMNEFTMFLRLGEQYLIRAEARANLGAANAINDLNAIRNRAGLSNYSGATDKVSLVAAIVRERRVELFSELGNRWFDLKRTGTIDAVMGPGGACAAKGGIWNSYQQLFPIDPGEIQKDPNLTQNSGY